MSTREQTQSIAINEEEKLFIETLAIASGLKPAALSRSLLFRGLVQFIADGHVREPGVMEEDIKEKLRNLIDEDSALTRAMEFAQRKLGSKSKDSDINSESESKTEPEQPPKKKSPIRIVGVIPGQVFDDAPKKKSVVEEKPGKKK